MLSRMLNIFGNLYFSFWTGIGTFFAAATAPTTLQNLEQWLRVAGLAVGLVLSLFSLYALIRKHFDKEE